MYVFTVSVLEVFLCSAYRESHKKSWCHLGKEIPSEYQKIIHNSYNEVIHEDHT